MAWGEQHSDTCNQCGKSILTTMQYLDKMEKAGVRVDRSWGKVNAIDVARTGTEKIVYDTGYQCNGCRTIYCHECLLDNALDNYGSQGGKICPKCGGRFSALVI
jgi:hypothetical protein